MQGETNGYILRQIEAAIRTYEANDAYESRDALFNTLVAAYEDELTDAFRRAGKDLVEVPDNQAQKVKEEREQAFNEFFSGG